MSNILIAGNGLDLYHGYKTSYVDFLIYAKKHNWHNVNGFINFFVSEVEADGIKLEEYSKDPDEYKYKWIDCEDEIKNIIECFKYVCDKKGVAKLTKYQSKILGSFKMLPSLKGISSGGVIASFTNKNGRFIKEELVDSLRHDLNNCIKYLKEYLEIATKDSSNISKFIDKEMNYIVSFNYTNTTSIYESNSFFENSFSIHGNLEKDNMVLGIEDYDKDDLDFIYFKKYFQRIQKRTDFYIQEEIGNSNPINNYFFGCSFGESDKDILRLLMWADNDNHDYPVNNIIYYYNQNDYEQKVKNLIGILGKELFLKWYKDNRLYFCSCG